MLDVLHLRQIVAIHQHGSFARAAEALGVAQPSLSNSIARLEDLLGVKLFDRTAAGSRPTPVAELLLARAPMVIAQADDIERDAALMASGAGEIRIGFGAALRETLAPRLLVHIADRHPLLKVTTSVAHATRLAPRLISREVDIVVVALDRYLDNLPVQSTPVFACDYAVAVAPSHPLAAARHRLTTEELLAYRCAGAPYGHGSTNLLSVADDHPNATAYMGDDFGLMAALARSGHCVLLAAACAIQDDLAAGRLVRLDVELQRSVVFGAVVTRAVSLSPLLRRIIAYTLAVGAELQAELGPPAI